MMRFRATIAGTAFSLGLGLLASSALAADGSAVCEPTLEQSSRITATARLAPQQLAACCKICRKGKACGNSCISRTKTCSKGKGCACDAQ